MGKRLLAALIGIGAGLSLVGAYFGAQSAGIFLRPELVVAGGAALAFAAAVAVFALLAMDRPAYRGVRGTLWLNEEPATEFIFPFKGPDVVPLLAKPEMSIGEILARNDAAFTGRTDAADKAVTLTIKGSAKKPFAALTLQQLFLALKPFQLLHVLLVSEKNEFVGYIPGKRALVEFAGEKTDEKIGKYIVKVLDDPSKSTVLREINGVSRDDTIGDTDDARHAEAKIWANDSVQGLVIHRHLKPFGYISKVDVLRLNAGRP